MKTTPSLLGPIVGGLSHNSANIWARSENPSTMYVWLTSLEDKKNAKIMGKAYLSGENGCTGLVSLGNLLPDTQYYYAVSLDEIRPAPSNFHGFYTFPEIKKKQSFSFAFGSCYLPPDRFGGQTMDELYKHIGKDGLRFGFMIGDQIYADDSKHNGLGYPAVTLNEFRAVYEKSWSFPVMQNLLPNIPLFMTLDDHEVADDWSWKDAARNDASMSILGQIKLFLKRAPQNQIRLGPDRVRAGLRAFWEHQAMHAPIKPKPNDINGPYAYSFSFGQAAFFVFDTRTQRIKREKILLGDEQWDMFEKWINNVKDEFPIKFLITSGSIFFPFLLDVSKDRWSGFRSERERLFELLAANEVEGVHILTGDLHSAHCISAELLSQNGKRIPIWELCSSAFEQKSTWVSNTYIPLRSKWIRNQNKHFRQTGRNFGIVNMDFNSTTPQVEFNLHYNEQGWKVRTIKTG